MGIPVCGHREDRKIEQDEEKSLRQSKGSHVVTGDPLSGSEPRCSVLGNKRAETFPCCIIYCLSHLGQGVSFHPTLAAPPLLPESLGLERRQLSFSRRSQVQAPGFGKRPPWSPWGWHSILCCWLGTLTPVQRGAPKRTLGGSDFRICLFNSNLVSECFRQLPPRTICFYVIELYSYKTLGHDELLYVNFV